MEIRNVDSRDIQPILAIQSLSPEIAQWTLWDYERVARGEMAGWVAEDAGQVVGFLIARRVVSDVEILNLAVHPQMRRHGAGAALLAHSILWSKAFDAERAILEVRASNFAALKFMSAIIFTRRAAAVVITLLPSMMLSSSL